MGSIVGIVVGIKVELYDLVESFNIEMEGGSDVGTELGLSEGYIDAGTTLGDKVGTDNGTKDLC